MGEFMSRVAPIIQQLCQQMGLPMPRLWVIPEQSPNAFATGRNPSHSSVAFTVGLLELMNDFELQGVIAHELGHVRNRDILTSSIAATIAGAITMLARFAMFIPLGGGSRDDDDRESNPLVGLLMMILAPIAAALIQMAISRTREFAADATAAKYCGTPDGLISGLRNLESWSHRIPMDATPATAHMFIIQPFTGGGFLKLFSTHPPTEERIAALERMRGRRPVCSRGFASVNRKGADRIDSGHPWILRSDVVGPRGRCPGGCRHSGRSGRGTSLVRFTTVPPHRSLFGSFAGATGHFDRDSTLSVLRMRLRFVPCR